MKKALLIPLLFIGFSQNVYSQNITSDTSFLKANIFLLNTVLIFNDIYNSDKQKADSDQLLNLKSNITKALSHINVVKYQYSNDKIFKKLQQNFEVTQKCLELLNANDPLWVLGFYIVKLEVQGYLNKELE